MFPELPGLVVRAAAPNGGCFVQRAGRERDYLLIELQPESAAHSGTRLRGRFARLAQLALPGFPRLVAYFEVDTRAFAALEPSTGNTLLEALKLRTLRVPEVVSLACDLGRSLGSLHGAGEVFGEISPANVLEGQDGWCFADYGTAITLRELPDSGSARRIAAPRWGWTDDLHSLARLLTRCLADVESVQPADEGELAQLREVFARASSAPGFGSVGEFVGAVRACVGLGPLPKPRRPLIGRRDELGRLRAFAASPASPRAAIVRGVGGIGKTHLVDTFVAEMDQRRVLRASCHQWDASFFGVVAQLVEAWVCNPDGTAAVERVDSLQRLVGELDQLFRPLSSRLRGAINAGNTKIPLETTQDVFTDGLVEAIARLLRSSLALVVIEDVQWMDEASRRVLRRVVDTADYPVLFLVTARSDLDESVQAQRFLGALQPIAVWDHQLEALSVAQSSELAAQHLRVLPLASEHAYALGVLGDGTPLGVLEVIRFVLDAGLLVPDWESWKLDVARVAELRLPTETVQLIGQRIRRLTSDAVEVLQIAAILGIRFEASLLRTVGDASLSRILAVLVDAQRCELIEAVDANRYRFVHQSICDALTSGWDSARLQMIHARALKALCEESGNDLEQLDSERVFRAAHHASLAQGHAPRSLVHAALSEAGKRAFDSFDNARALGLLSRADALAPGEYHGRGNYLLAEVYLRLGDLPSSLERFRVLVAKQESAEQRAQVWSRICWIHESEFDSEAAWAALGQAFACLGEPFPQSRVPLAVSVPKLLFTTPAQSSGRQLEGSERQRAELLCVLLFQLLRLASARSQLGPLLDAAGRARKLVTGLGPSGALSRVNNLFAFVQTIFGRKTAAQTFASAALSMAESQQDPVEQAYSLSVATALALWRDEIDRGIQLGQLHITRFRNWLSPQDITITAANIALIGTVRGRVPEAWPWLEQAAERALQYDGVVPVVPDMLYLMCRGAAIHLGIDVERRVWLERLRAACRPVPEGSAFFLWSLGARVHVLTEAGGGGEALQDLITQVDLLELNPKRVHLVVATYYIALAHALIHEYLRAPQEQRPRRLEQLQRTARDLRRAARLGLLQAHAHAVQGCLQLFQGNSKRSERELAIAERLARQHNAPWVLYAIARARAHKLRREGSPADAERQARLAEQIAGDNGSIHRARWIREEFNLGLLKSIADTSSVSGDTAANDLAKINAVRNERHIQALLGIGRVNSEELDPEQQARAVVDVMVDAVRAERGYLFLRASGKGQSNLPTSLRDLTLIAGRSRSRMSLHEGLALPQRAIERVLAERKVLLLQPEADETCQVLTLPLAVRDVVVGVVCLESAPGAGHFDLRDGEVLSALVGQVSFALELTRAVRDRERLAEDLQQAQKMEAVGRLAGGIAHDFNNMLAAICVSVEAVIAESPPTSSYRSDLETIQGAADRATRLTRQLLAFSRRQVFDARPLDLNDTVRDIVPMLQRLLGSNVELETELDPALCVVKTDAAQLEQVLVNLAVNARDAMPHGGTLLLRTREVQLEPGQKPGLEAGTYAVLHVIDDGVGMDAETQRRIFEPFFSTKARDEGTGLGLSMVYGIVRQSSGHIELDSAVGMGTEFRVYLPKTSEVVATVTPPMPVTRSPSAAARVLLVDDEPLVRHAFRRALKRLGHNVIGAASAREAIQYLQQQPDVDLIITDVIMPGMNGLEMIERLQKLGIRSKVLYVSGYADGVLSRRAGLGDRIEFMQKPIQSEALAAKVQDLLQSKTLDRHA